MRLLPAVLLVFGFAVSAATIEGHVGGIAASIFFWLASVTFSFRCLLLTGRYPGEAKMARKSITATIEQRSAAAAEPLTQAWGT